MKGKDAAAVKRGMVPQGHSVGEILEEKPRSKRTGKGPECLAAFRPAADAVIP